MGLFSKLFGGDKEAEKTAKDLFNALFNEQNAKEKEKPEKADNNSEPAAGQQTEDPSSSGSDYSVYEDVPAEENQYNYNGPFFEYFEKIFKSEFSEYRYDKAEADGLRRIAYTFYSGAQKVLVVELYSGESKKLKKECARANIPYLRFYHDHEGWWNTRSYVVERMRRALGKL